MAFLLFRVKRCVYNRPIVTKAQKHKAGFQVLLKYNNVFFVNIGGFVKVQFFAQS